MTTLEFMQRILCETASVAAQGCAYHIESNSDVNGNYISGWTKTFIYEKLMEIWADTPSLSHRSVGRRITIMDLKSILPEELYKLGFCNWSEKLILIPIWLYNYISDGEQLITINDEIVTKGIDNLDVRGACIAFGFLRQ